MDARIRRIFIEDQNDRKLVRSGVLDFSQLRKQDKERKEKIVKILRKKRNFTKTDFFSAAIIFHHSGALGDLSKARTLAEKSAVMGHLKSKRLLELITDRELIHRGRKQRFGTQGRLCKSKPH